MTQKKTLGLALGGGGARGLAHIGIIEVLEEAGIKVNYVTGTSMGAIIGGLFALGKTPKQMEYYALKMAKKNMSKQHLNIWHESLIKADSIHKMFDLMYKKDQFEDCKIPFRCTAVDIESGKAECFHSGPLSPAILASSALPFILPPVFHDGKVFVDGGLLNNVPLSLLNEFKPDITLGIKINSFASRQDISGAIFRHYYAPKYRSIFKSPNFLRKIRDNIDLQLNIIMRSFDVATEEGTRLHIEEAKPDLMLTPLIDIHILEFQKAKEAIQAGRDTMKAALPKLKKLLGI